MTEDWIGQLSRLDEAIRPIARREIDLSSLDDELAHIDPLGEADVRDEAEALILDILNAMSSADDKGRREIRGLVDRYPSFFWAASPPGASTPLETLRRYLLHFALTDRGRDPRDAVVWLGVLAETPGVSKGEIASTAREVAPLASGEDKYGWGSTRSMLLERLAVE